MRVVGVEVGGGLVGKDELGALDHGAGDGDALAFTAGELGGPGLRLFRQPDPFQGLHYRFFTCGGAALLQQQGKLDVVIDRKDRQQVVGLKNKADVVVAQGGRLVVAEPRDFLT